jgi:hypothetical protein
MLDVVMRIANEIPRLAASAAHLGGVTPKSDEPSNCMTSRKQPSILLSMLLFDDYCRA